MPQNIHIYLAPFQGITGASFRSVYAKHFSGVDKMFTPFFTTIQKDAKLPPRKRAELGNIEENGVEVVPQILSKDADEIIRFATFCEQLGFKELNWNLGCPYPQVANKKRGSGMLPYPEMINDILEKVMPFLNIRFSIKCRLGYASKEDIYKLVPIFSQYDISELTIHARIGKQLYTGEPDRDAFHEILPIIKSPLVYNGDIFSYNDYLQFQKLYPESNSWMIGRGLLYNPFLAAEIKGLPITDDCKKLVYIFITDLYLAYRRQMNDNLSAISVLKEYWSYLSNSFSDPHKVFKRIKKVNSFAEYEYAIASVFDDYDLKNSMNKEK